MQVAITDANIFIDLYELELLQSFFQLPYEIHTTIFVLEELEEECCLIVQNESTILNVSDEYIDEFDSFDLNKGFSFPDKSILYLAFKFKMLIFSGEKKMKSWCTSKDLESHGILFILQEFIDKNILTQEEVKLKLHELMEFNQWLPTEICLELLDKWSN